MGVCPFSILGPWLTSIPSLIGQSQALDTAVVYAMDSLDLYQRREARKTYMAPDSAANALMALCDALDSDDRLANSSHVVAVSLILAAEVSPSGQRAGLLLTLKVLPRGHCCHMRHTRLCYCTNAGTPHRGRLLL